jgi:predicted nucleic acid-binding protein
VVTLTEVLVHPLREGRRDLVRRYSDILLGSASFDTIPVSAGIAEHAAQIRATRRLRTPDAIQLATAASAGAAVFLTNDFQLSEAADLELLVLSELADN